MKLIKLVDLKNKNVLLVMAIFLSADIAIFGVNYAAANTSANISSTLPASTAYERLKSPPLANTCNPELITKSLENSLEKIGQIKNGISPSGILGGATFKMNSCADGICQPLSENSQDFAPSIGKDLSDPCVVHCVLKHEWFHFTDMRLWNLNASEIDLVRLWELPAYEVEAQCLKAFRDAR